MIGSGFAVDNTTLAITADTEGIRVRHEYETLYREKAEMNIVGGNNYLFHLTDRKSKEGRMMSYMFVLRAEAVLLKRTTFASRTQSGDQHSSQS